MNISRYLIRASLMLSIAAPTMAQTTADSVVLGPQYRDQVFYSLKDGVKSATPLASWDIAFELTGLSSSILTNGGTGTQLFVVPGRTAADWSQAIDTNGMAAGWDSHYNSIESWSGGAFNMGRDYNTGDFGWGQYSMVTHTVSGTTLYVIRLANGTARKIMIQGLASRVYSFRYANLDGSNEMSATIAKDDYEGKHFGYYSLQENKSVDLEPQSSDWDLVFGKYITMLGPDADMPYGVTGVLANEGVMIAEISSADPATEPVPSGSAFIDSIATIGYDWKSFTGSTYQVNATTAYFVRTRDGEIYRMRFTGFAGGSTGTSRFEKTLLGVSRVRQPGGVHAGLSIHPNVIGVGESFHVVHDLATAAAEARLDVYDLQGARVHSTLLSSQPGLHQLALRLDLPAGIYFATMTIDGERTSQRLIVQ